MIPRDVTTSTALACRLHLTFSGAIFKIAQNNCCLLGCVTGNLMHETLWLRGGNEWL